MDGVLYDSMPNHAIAWQESMARFQIHMTAEDAYATEGARGVDTIRMMVRIQQQREIDEPEAQKMYDVKTHLFHEMPDARIFYGVKSLMRKIRQCGMTIGVVTGSGQRPLLNRLLNDFGEFLDEDHIVTAYDVKRGKPYPDPYLKGLQIAGVPASEAVVVENAPLGIRAAVAAGIDTIAVNTGPLEDEILLAEKPVLLLHSMQELADNLENLFA
jgi:HAD superfamily hydrolase (TIGR01509 family)